MVFDLPLYSLTILFIIEMSELSYNLFEIILVQLKTHNPYRVQQLPTLSITRFISLIHPDKSY